MKNIWLIFYEKVSNSYKNIVCHKECGMYIFCLDKGFPSLFLLCSFHKNVSAFNNFSFSPGKPWKLHHWILLLLWNLVGLRQLQPIYYCCSKKKRKTSPVTAIVLNTRPYWMLYFRDFHAIREDLKNSITLLLATHVDLQHEIEDLRKQIGDKVTWPGKIRNSIVAAWRRINLIAIIINDNRTYMICLNACLILQHIFHWRSIYHKYLHISYQRPKADRLSNDSF